jgi:HEAT repeat protein
MGKNFILLMTLIIIVGGILGWLVLSGERNLAEGTMSRDSLDEEISSASNQRSIPRQRQQEDPADDQLETQEELLRLVNDPQAAKRVDAVLKLIHVEQQLSTLVPALGKILVDNDELVRIAAGIVLNKIGPKGAEHLRALIESENVSDNAIACSALKEMGGANLYLPQIRKWLTSVNSETRKLGLFALQGSKEGVLEVLQEVTDTLDDKDFNVACMACRVLVKLGPDGIDAIPKLIELRKTGIPSSRSWAAVALGAIGPNTEFDTASYLAGTLDAFVYQEKQRSLEGLALMGPEAISVADDVRDVMRDAQRRVMPEAAFALWRITGETDEPIKVLSEALDNPDIVDQTIVLVGKMGAAAKPLVGRISNALTTGEAGLQEAAAIALGEIGPAAAEAIPALKSIAENPNLDGLIRYYAREAIEKIEAGDRKPAN